MAWANINVMKRTFINFSLKTLTTILMVTASLLLSSCGGKTQETHVLVFSKTTGFRHSEAIAEGKKAFLKLAKKHNFTVNMTEDATAFNEDNLKQYRAVVFLNVSGSVLNAQQRNSFKRYIQSGGGILGIHAAADAEHDWSWYTKLIGAQFKSHPNVPSNVQQGSYLVLDQSHISTHSLPATWERKDEFYDFQKVNPDINVLVNIDETTYQGGITGKDHPAVWYQEFSGGRSYYTAMGHTPESYSEPLFLDVLWGGLTYVMGEHNKTPLNFAQAHTQKIPETNRFIKQDLLTDLNEPMTLDFSDSGDVFFTERSGNIHVYNLHTDDHRIIGKVPVLASYEDGLLGLALDPKHTQNKWLYLFYTHPSGEKFIVSRFELDQNGLLNLGSEKALLTIEKEILDGSHTGGDLIFDPNGSGDLFIAVGDNSSPRATGFAPIDERPDRLEFDAQRTSANTNDLRGKILRIHPEPNGTYTIPKGNLFEPGTPKTRPEIYTMGHRQPWRLSIDPKTGWLFLGDVGPDANEQVEGFGPAGHDEFNLVKKPGNFGWPYFVGNNKAYWNVNFTDNTSSHKFDETKPINTSPNNTGLTELPPAQKAFLWYPYAQSKEFPTLGSGGRSATGGPVFRKENFKGAKTAFPAYYEGKWFITDWMRGWVNVVSLDTQGNYDTIEPFMGGHKFVHPIDMDFGPDGNLYILEYGTGWFQGNPDAKLVKVEYNGGNRPPSAKITADRKGGSLPLNVNLTSSGSDDLDNDKLQYQWEVLNNEGESIHSSQKPSLNITFDTSGIYQATLTVDDLHGATDSSSVEIIAGNAEPELSILLETDKNYFVANETIEYQVTLFDHEDGSLKNGDIDSHDIDFEILYLPEHTDLEKILNSANPSATPAELQGAEVMINEGDCRGCHLLTKESVGPTFTDIAVVYKDDENAISKLSDKIINGGSGTWGEVSMSAHPEISLTDAENMVRYILNLAKDGKTEQSQPLKGKYTFKLPDGDNGKGTYVFKAVYTDKGTDDLPSITAMKTIILNSK